MGDRDHGRGAHPRPRAARRPRGGTRVRCSRSRRRTGLPLRGRSGRWPVSVWARGSARIRRWTRSRTAAASRPVVRRPAGTAPSWRRRSSTPPGSSWWPRATSTSPSTPSPPARRPASRCSTGAGKPATTCCAPPPGTAARPTRLPFPTPHPPGGPAGAAQQRQHRQQSDGGAGQQHARQLLQPGRPHPGRAPRGVPQPAQLRLGGPAGRRPRGRAGRGRPGPAHPPDRRACPSTCSATRC